MTQATAPSALDQIRAKPSAEQLPALSEYLNNGRAKIADAMALRDEAMRKLAAEGWTQRQIATAAKLSVASVRVILRPGPLIAERAAVHSEGITDVPAAQFDQMVSSLDEDPLGGVA